MIQFDVRIFFIHGLKLNHQLVTYLFGKVGMEGMNEATLRRSSDLDGGRHGSSKVQSTIKTQILNLFQMLSKQILSKEHVQLPTDRHRKSQTTWSLRDSKKQ